MILGISISKTYILIKLNRVHSVNKIHMNLKRCTFLNTPTKFLNKPPRPAHQPKVSEMGPRSFSGVEQDRTRDSKEIEPRNLLTISK